MRKRQREPRLCRHREKAVGADEVGEALAGGQVVGERAPPVDLRHRSCKLAAQRTRFSRYARGSWRSDPTSTCGICIWRSHPKLAKQRFVGHNSRRVPPLVMTLRVSGSRRVLRAGERTRNFASSGQNRHSRPVALCSWEHARTGTKALSQSRCSRRALRGSGQISSSDMSVTWRISISTVEQSFAESSLLFRRPLSSSNAGIQRSTPPMVSFRRMQSTRWRESVSPESSRSVGEIDV